MEASPFIYDTVKGLILIVAVVVDRISSLRQSKAMLEQKSRKEYDMQYSGMFEILMNPKKKGGRKNEKETF